MWAALKGAEITLGTATFVVGLLKHSKTHYANPDNLVK